jgi:hypothetical protein
MNHGDDMSKEAMSGGDGELEPSSSVSPGVIAGTEAKIRKHTEALAKAIFDIVTEVPKTTEAHAGTPRERARAIQTAASLKAAAISGTLALPSGPLGIAVILPDLISVWRVQAKMVADIAGAYGQSAHLSQEHMVYCLFRHAAAQVVRDLAARVGRRVVIRKATIRAIHSMAQQLGIRVSKQVIAKSAARWLPVVGSLGVAGYAYYDTAQVATTATELFDSTANDGVKSAAE